MTLIPLKSYLEKDGTFVNHAGVRQTVSQGLTIVPNALSLCEVVAAFAGGDHKYCQQHTQIHNHPHAYDKIGDGRIHNEATAKRGAL